MSNTSRFYPIDFWSAYWHEPIKNKNKNGIFEVVFGFQKWTSIFEFWRLSKTGCHFFPCFWFPIGTRYQGQKQKRHFCFCSWRPYWNDLRIAKVPRSGSLKSGYFCDQKLKTWPFQLMSFCVNGSREGNEGTVPDTCNLQSSHIDLFRSFFFFSRFPSAAQIDRIFYTCN